MHDTGATVEINGIIYKIYLDHKHSDTGNAQFSYKPITHDYREWNFQNEPDNDIYKDASPDDFLQTDFEMIERIYNTAEQKHSHYFKEWYGKLDVYRVLDLFDVADPCLQHAIKKLLCTGKRGHKDFKKDIQDSIDTLQRKLEMLEEDEKV